MKISGELFHSPSCAAFLSLSSCARDLAWGIASTLGGWIVSKQPDRHLVHFNWLGWIAGGAGLLSILLARTVKVNDTGGASPLATAARTTGSRPTEPLVAAP